MAEMNDTKVCTKCGVEKHVDCFSPKRGACKQCRAAYNASPEVRERMKKHYKKWSSKPESKKLLVENAKKNVARQKAANRASYERNREKVLAKNKEYRNRPERAAINAETKRKWIARNPGYSHVNNQNRRVKTAGQKLSKNLADRLFASQKGKCVCCGLSLGDNYHLDHIMPLALGGPNIDSNMQLLRGICNRKKQAKHPIDYMQSRGFLL